MVSARQGYVQRFSPCSFATEASENDEFATAFMQIEENDLPKYLQQIELAKREALEQFQGDFLYKLKDQIEKARNQLNDLNRTLRKLTFNGEQYQFKVFPSQDNIDFYNMITDPLLTEDHDGIFGMEYQNRYKVEIDTFFSSITTTDEVDNERIQKEIEENISKYSDYRSYLIFDIELKVTNKKPELLSETLKKKSGGETQTPFYIAMLASFAQIYKTNDSSEVGNTIRLAVFDEAFSKMDSGRMIECLKMLRDMNIQAIFCTPPEKVSDFALFIDNTLIANHDKEHHVALIADYVDHIQAIDFQNVKSVLFVENKTCYDEMRLHFRKDILYVYHGGHTSPRRRAFFKLLAQFAHNDASIYFWADIDLGGFKMFMKLKECFPKLLPFYMSSHEVIQYAAQAMLRPDTYFDRLHQYIQQNLLPEKLKEAAEALMKTRATIEKEVMIQDLTLMLSTCPK